MTVICWQCHCGITQPGETLGVVGAHDQMGAWNPSRAVPLSTDESLFPLWKSERVIFNNSTFLLEYKYIIYAPNGSHKWEPFRGNRVLHLNSSTHCIVESTWGSKESDSLRYKTLGEFNEERLSSGSSHPSEIYTDHYLPAPLKEDSLHMNSLINVNGPTLNSSSSLVDPIVSYNRHSCRSLSQSSSKPPSSRISSPQNSFIHHPSSTSSYLPPLNILPEAAFTRPSPSTPFSTHLSPLSYPYSNSSPTLLPSHNPATPRPPFSNSHFLDPPLFLSDSPPNSFIYPTNYAQAYNSNWPTETNNNLPIAPTHIRGPYTSNNSTIPTYSLSTHPLIPISNYSSSQDSQSEAVSAALNHSTIPHSHIPNTTNVWGISVGQFQHPLIGPYNRGLSRIFPSSPLCHSTSFPLHSSSEGYTYPSPYPLNRDYTLTATIGTGTWGLVKVARQNKTGTEVAVKHISKSPYMDHMQRIYREVDVMRRLDHPNIVTLYDVYEDTSTVYLVMEYCSGGELFDRLVNKLIYSETLACHIMHQILLAVEHCHSRHIAHRDLKPENFLFLNRTPSSPLKLIDFGLASPCDPNFILQTKLGTAYYVSPEVIEGAQHGISCDMWSIGVILYLLLYGYPPFNGSTDSEIFAKIKEGHFSFPHEDWCTVSEAAKDLVCKLLTKEPSKRLTSREALEHPWILNFIHNGGTVCQHCFITQPPHFSHQPVNTQDFSNRQTDYRHCLTNLDQFRRYQKLSRLNKLALTLMGQASTDTLCQILRDTFEKYDTNSNYLLSWDIIKQAMKALPSPLYDHDEAILEQTFYLLDTNHNGKIHYAEFIAACLSKSEIKKEEVCKTAFNMLDLNRRGKFSSDEAKQMCIGLGCSESDLDKDILEADLDGDGEINYEEFKKIMVKIPSLTSLTHLSDSPTYRSLDSSFSAINLNT